MAALDRRSERCRCYPGGLAPGGRPNELRCSPWDRAVGREHGARSAVRERASEGSDAVRIQEASRSDVDVVVDLITAMLREMDSYSNQGFRGEDLARLYLQGRFLDSCTKQHPVYLTAAVEEEEDSESIRR